VNGHEGAELRSRIGAKQVKKAVTLAIHETAIIAEPISAAAERESRVGIVRYMTAGTMSLRSTDAARRLRRSVSERMDHGGGRPQIARPRREKTVVRMVGGCRRAEAAC
jgi:hypothetical protein